MGSVTYLVQMVSTTHCSLQSVLFFFLNLLLRDKVRQSMSRGGTEREGDTIQNRLQALSCRHRAQSGAQTHKP